MPTAAECHQQGLLVVAACESVDAINRDREALGNFGIDGGRIAEEIHDGGEQEKSTLQTLAGLLNSLSTELFRREQLCITYTEDMARYEQDKAKWLADFAAWDSGSSSHPYPQYTVTKPEPPFEGAEAG